jgi:hypothetical protein
MTQLSAGMQPLHSLSGLLTSTSPNTDDCSFGRFMPIPPTRIPPRIRTILLRRRPGPAPPPHPRPRRPRRPRRLVPRPHRPRRLVPRPRRPRRRHRRRRRRHRHRPDRHRARHRRRRPRRCHRPVHRRQHQARTSPSASRPRTRVQVVAPLPSLCLWPCSRSAAPSSRSTTGAS